MAKQKTAATSLDPIRSRRGFMVARLSRAVHGRYRPDG
jgi:hypothetical protein